jgi:hypothetical protein
MLNNPGLHGRLAKQQSRVYITGLPHPLFSASRVHSSPQMSSPIKVPAQVAAPHHRHRSSLERVIDFSAQHPPSDTQRVLVASTFQTLLNHCKQMAGADQPYKWVNLLELTHNFARGQDAFLHYILSAAAGHPRQEDFPTPGISQILSELSGFDTWSGSDKGEVGGRLKEIAETLLTCFFMQCMTSPNIPVVST